jgi:Putative zinc-finger
MLTCREASHLLSEGLDRPLRPWERLGLRIHLGICRGCSAAEGQLRILRKAMAALAGRPDERDAGRK